MLHLGYRGFLLTYYYVSGVGIEYVRVNKTANGPNLQASTIFLDDKDNNQTNKKISHSDECYIGN